MEPPLVLAAEAAAATHSLHLLSSTPVKFNFGAERAAIARSTFQFKVDPFVIWRDRIFVDKQRSTLVGHNHIEHASIPQIGEYDRASIVRVCRAHRLRHVIELARAIVYPDTLLLIARQAAALHRGPVLGIADNGAVAAGDL